MHLFDAKKRPDSIAVGWKGVILYQDLSPHPLRLVEGQHQQVKVHRQPVHDGHLVGSNYRSENIREEPLWVSRRQPVLPLLPSQAGPGAAN